MNRVVHFEVAADDPERAAKFYETTFGRVAGGIAAARLDPSHPAESSEAAEV